MKVAWSQIARNELRNILLYFADKNPQAGCSLVEDIERRTEALLGQYPHIRPSTDPRGLRELPLPPHPYRVLYRVTDDVVHILRVQDTRQGQTTLH